MSTSMTKGSPLKLMLQFALPLLMGNLLQQTYNIIDAAIVGQILGADALASVDSSSSVQFLVLGFVLDAVPVLAFLLPDILAPGIIVLCEITYLMARYLQQLLRQSL